MDKEQIEEQPKFTIDNLITYFGKILKFFSFHAILTLVSKKNLILKGEFTAFFKALFNKQTLKNSVLYSTISLTYKFLLSLYPKYGKAVFSRVSSDTYKILATFASVFSASYFIETGSTFKDIIITVLMKAIVSIVESQVFRPLNLFQQESKLNDYLLMAFAATFYNLMRLINPGYDTLDKLVIKHSKYFGNEREENIYLIQNSKVL